MAEIEPTQSELDDISLCAQKIWDLDTNRLQPEIDYGINVQAGTRLNCREDVAEDRLFGWVSSSVWERPTYRALLFLLDNYEKETGIDENMTEIERKETDTFMEEVMKSAPMRYTHRYLVAKELASDDAEEFRQAIHALWFNFYRRDSRSDSSGFEHVFVGESDDNRVKGFHNWVQFYAQEANGAVNYKGYIIPRTGPNPDVNERLLELQLDWDSETKRITSLLIGVSPEFELALYTLYFLAGGQDNYANLLNYRINIKCYKIRADRIGSTYVQRISETEDV